MRNNIDLGTKNKGGIFSEVMILTASTLICKVIGLLFKIPIIGIVGIDGMAYFSAAYNIYMLLNSVSAAGLPVALSILISKNIAEGNKSNVGKTFTVSIMIFAVLGTLSTALLYFGSDYYSEVISMRNASAAVKAISPTLFFICICGGIRGYFQGHKRMKPTAVSQLIESIGKLVLGVAFAQFVVKKGMGVSAAAAAAVFGLSIGVLLSMLYLLIRLALFRKNDDIVQGDSRTDSVSKISQNLFYIAFPITLSSCITSLTGVADTALITNRLISSGLSHDAAVTLYSSYVNLAIPLFNLLPALVAPIAISLVPSLTSAVTKGNLAISNRLFSESVRLCNLLAIPSSIGLAVFAKPILLFIYPGESEASNFAAPLLSALSVSIIFSCLISIMNAVLQAYMKPILPIVSMSIGATVKIIIEYILVGSDLGIMGAPISTIACTSTILIADLIFVYIYTPHRLVYKSAIKTVIVSVVSITTAVAVYYLLLYCNCMASLALMCSIVFTVIIYSLLVMITGMIRTNDIIKLPFGSKFVSTLLKLKLIKE